MWLYLRGISGRMVIPKVNPFLYMYVYLIGYNLAYMYTENICVLF